MMRALSVAVGVFALVVVAGVAFAQMGGGMGGAMMGPGSMGGMMGGAAGQPGSDQAGCHGTAAGQAAITEGQARDLAQKYADANLPGFNVTRVSPFNGMHGTMYAVELAGPGSETRAVHVSPMGHVMPADGHHGPTT